MPSKIFAVFVCLFTMGWPSEGVSQDGLERVSLSVASDRAYVDLEASKRSDELSRHVEQLLQLQPVRDAAILTQMLIAPAKNDQEKAWLVYRWVAGRVSYDDSASAKLGAAARRSTEHMMNYPRGTCAVYAHLAHAMFKLAGLESKLIYGEVKTSADSSRRGRLSHAWNAVRLDGRWWTIDTTWGAGYLSESGFVRQESDVFFMIPRAWVALNYYDPADTVGAQQELGISKATFNRLSEGGLKVSAVGFSVMDVLQVADRGAALVEVYSVPVGAFKVIQAPVVRQLSRGVIQHFNLQSIFYEELVVVQGDDWTYLKKSQDRFDVAVRPKFGELLVMGRKRGRDDFEALLGYSTQ
jgi:hypothetical protein